MVEAQVLDAESGLVYLKDVRLGYRSLWTLGMYKGKRLSRFSATFVFSEKEKPEFDKVAKMVFNRMKAEKPDVKSVTDTAYQRFKKVEKETSTQYLIKTSNSETYPVRYFDANGQEVINPKEERIEEKVLYPGCRVNAKIQFGIQRDGNEVILWPNFVAVQFCGNDEPFGGLTNEQVAEGFEPVAMKTGGEKEDVSEEKVEEDFDLGL